MLLFRRLEGKRIITGRYTFRRNEDKVPEKYSIALLQNCYNFFTLDLDLLTGKNAGDIINLNSEG